MDKDERSAWIKALDLLVGDSVDEDIFYDEWFEDLLFPEG